MKPRRAVLATELLPRTSKGEVDRAEVRGATPRRSRAPA